MSLFRPIRHLAISMALAMPWMSAAADEPYPVRPISIVVPFPPGGVADIVARAIAPGMERALGQPVVVVNRPGAGGTVGAAAVTRAAADGHTLLLALASISTNPEQDRIAGRSAAFELADLAPLARISVEPMLLAVRPDSRYRTLRDLVEDARRRPGVLSYASSGVYGVYHVATEMFARAAGIQANHVPYNGGAPALIALVGGDVDFGLVTRSVGLKQLQAGKLRPLAAWGDQRWDEFPDVPTVRELGFSGGEYTLWSGLFARSGVPQAAATKIREAVRATVTDPSFAAAMARLHIAPAYLDAPDFARFWEGDASRLASVVRRMGKLE